LPPVLGALTIVLAAVEGAEEHSKTLFYVAGAVLAIFAVLISLVGISRIGTFPASKGQARGVIGLCALLVLAAMASAIITA
jgi:hypothetical protein